MRDLNLNYKTAAFVALLIFAVGFITGFAISRKYSPSINLPVVTIQRDTTIVRDTVKGKVLPPRVITIKRVDTLRLEINPANDSKYKVDTTARRSTPDTSTTPRVSADGQLLIPISSKEYKTDEYRAIVSGWRASLDTIEVYGKTRNIIERRIEKSTVNRRPWLALVAGGGAGYTPEKKIVPYVGLTLGVVLWSNK